MRINVISVLLFALISVCVAGDGGSITAMGIITGNDGNDYIYLRHSKSGDTFGSGTNTLNGQVYIPWDESKPAYMASQVSILKDAYKDASKRIIITKGRTSNQIDGTWRVVGTRWYISD